MLEILIAFNISKNLYILDTTYGKKIVGDYWDKKEGLKSWLLRIAVSGAPQDVLTEDCMEQLYGIKLEVASVNGKMIVLAV